MMNETLQQALKWLDFDNEEQAYQFFVYLNDAGYLSDELIEKACLYLEAEQPFLGNVAGIVTHLKEARELISDKEQFLTHFGAQCSAIDIVDLLVFVQQTAFDRTFGIERNLLTAKPWMEDQVTCSNFMTLQQSLGLVEEQIPNQDHYYAIGIMGASYLRAESRTLYFRDQLRVAFDAVFAVTGQRDLSKGLDREENIQKVAAALGIEPTYVSENKQEVTKEISETQMVRYLIQTLCPDHADKMEVIDSTPGEWHWRADTTQNAKDFAWTLMQKIQNSEPPSRSHCYPILLIVEQPYSNRMAKQVRRALQEAVQAYNEKTGLALCFSVEAVGKGLPCYEALSDELKMKHVTQCNSDFAAWIGECYKDARVFMASHANTEGRALRHPNSVMFSTRDKHYAAKPQKEKLQAPPERYSFVANTHEVPQQQNVEAHNAPTSGC